MEKIQMHVRIYCERGSLRAGLCSHRYRQGAPAAPAAPTTALVPGYQSRHVYAAIRHSIGTTCAQPFVPGIMANRERRASAARVRHYSAR